MVSLCVMGWGLVLLENSSSGRALRHARVKGRSAVGLAGWRKLEGGKGIARSGLAG